MADKTIPGDAEMFEDVVVGIEDTVEVPDSAHEPPDILDRVPEAKLEDVNRNFPDLKACNVEGRVMLTI